MAECYLHNQLPKDVNIKLGTSITFFIQSGTHEKLLESWGEMERKGIGGPAINTIWIITEDIYIKKVEIISEYLPVGEKGMAVFWAGEEGIAERAYYWDDVNTEWVSTEAYVYTSQGYWKKFAEAWNGKIDKWIFAYSDTTGIATSGSSETSIIGGGDSRILSYGAYPLAAYDRITITDCYATSDMIIGILKIDETEFYSWTAENFTYGYVTIKKAEFEEAGDKGVTVSLPIPRPSSREEAFDCQHATAYQGYRVGVIVSSMPNPKDTIVRFGKVYCRRNETGVNAPPYHLYNNKETPIGGINRA